MIPVNTPLFQGNEKKYLNECIDTGWISSEGSFVQRFEEAMANLCNRKYATAVSSGTAALDIAVRLLDLKENEEVIMPSFTIISCAQALINQKIKPILIDSDFYTFNMKIEDIEKKITKNTKAIMIVHIYGLCVDMNPILTLAKKYNLRIIEDAAQMHGQKYYDKPCGSFGDISVFSFYPNKLITTGEGGMVLVNEENLDKKAKELRNLCFTKDRFIHEDLGYNYRITNMQAALGLAQVEQIEKIVKKKKFIGNRYNELLKNIPYINLPIQKTSYCENLYWVYAITLKDNYKKDAKDIMNELAKFKIGTRPFFYPMHKQPIFNKMGFFKNTFLPNSEKLYKKGFYIPSGLGLSNENINNVSKALHKIFK